MIDLRLGDCLDVMRGIPDASIDAVVTSPPYFKKIDYQTGADQIGQESTPIEYCKRLGAIYGEMRRVMKEGATFWLVIGDTYNNSAPIRKSMAERKDNRTVPYSQRRRLIEGYREKELLGIPFLLKDEIRASGFVWRSLNIWHKPVNAYDSGEDRPTVNHEYVFQFIKASGNGRPYANCERIEGSVWSINPEGYAGHPCVFPVALAEKIIEAATSAGDWVMDVMCGAGTTLIAALNKERNAIGIEISSDFYAIAQRRIQEAQAQIAMPMVTA